MVGLKQSVVVAAVETFDHLEAIVHETFGLSAGDCFLHSAAEIVILEVKRCGSVGRSSQAVFAIPGIGPIAVGQHIAVDVVGRHNGIHQRILIQRVCRVTVARPGQIRSQAVADRIVIVAVVIRGIGLRRRTGDFASVVVGIVDRVGSAEGAAGLGAGGAIAEGIVGIFVFAHGRCPVFVFHRGNQIATTLITEVGRKIAIGDRRWQIAVRQIAVVERIGPVPQRCQPPVIVVAVGCVVLRPDIHPQPLDITKEQASSVVGIIALPRLRA
ncbi:hypothetical protein SDC9_137534 [bioreactor metagenome]|uniref:Uncharacterized protein n=1 Tax=bioreactor metagenome TaxID=1076179 RepID=A0A645DNQ2_9ZZZZ